MASNVFDLDAALAQQGGGTPTGSVFDLDAALAAQAGPGRSVGETTDSSWQTLLDTLLSPGQTLLGAGKRALEYGYNLSPAKAMGNPAGSAFQPEGPMQEGGAKALDFLSFLAPGGPVKGLAGMAAQGAKAGGIAAVQGETGGNAILSAILGSLGPAAASVAGKAAGPLKAGAERQMARVLGPTTRENKAITEKVVPELLGRGFKGMTREGLLAKASGQVEKAGQTLERELVKIPAGKTLNTKPVLDAMDEAKAAFQTGTKTVQKQINGKMVDVVEPIYADPAAVRQIDAIRNIVDQHGKDVSVASLRKLRQIWDRQVAHGKGFYGKTLREGSELEVKRDAAGAIRAELAKEFPDVAKVNKELSFWLKVEKVLEETVERTRSQQKSLGEQVIRGGAVAGGISGVGMAGGAEAATAAAAIAALNKLVRSTAWNTLAAVQKNRLADMIAGGRMDEALAMIARLGAGGTAQWLGGHRGGGQTTTGQK